MQQNSELFYCSRQANCKSPFGAVAAGENITFTVYPERAKAVLGVSLTLQPDGGEEIAYPMAWCGLFGARDGYTVSLSLPETGLYWYRFTVTDASGTLQIGRAFGGVGKVGQADPFQLTVYDGAYQPPAWFGRGISYQVFPDRFCREHAPQPTTGEGVAARVLHDNWEDTPIWQPDENGEVLNNDFFGGTLRGIESKLHYLKSLHVTTLYLNPIFQSFSNHRYDTGDYRKIDPLLGTEDDFRHLCAAAKKQGIRILLDGVFNHTGMDSRYFNARGHYDSVGAAQSQQSPYYPWYDFSEWPTQYSSWWGIGTLPQTREDDPAFQDFIIRDQDSVVRHWLRMGASGWRLDVADELPDAFIAALCKAAKEEKKDALVLGEVWEDASNKIAYSERRRYFQGGELDSVMNYPLRDAIFAFLGGGRSINFAETMECLRENYPKAVYYNLMNSIGTHDTPRVLTVLGAKQEDWQRPRAHRADSRLTSEEKERAEKRERLAAVLQFCMPGSPTIYYGDEAGMQGFEDPLNRRTYPWGKEERSMIEFYRRLCQVRADSAALTDGEIQFVPSVETLVHFVRQQGRETLHILVNRGGRPRRENIDDAAAAVDLMSEALFAEKDDGGLVVTIPAETAYILRVTE